MKKLFKKNKNIEQNIFDNYESTAETSIDVELLRIQPTNQNDANDIVKNLIEGKAVLINISKLNDQESMRTIAFVLGALVVLKGEYRKIASKTYLFVSKKEHLSQFKDLTSFKNEM